MHLVAQVGRLRVGIVHGDAAALAGWRFAQTRSTMRANRPWLNDVPRGSHIDVFACTHTCLAALRDFALPAGRLTVINNGAAGMPNFSGSALRRHHPHRHDALAASRRSTGSRATACISTRSRSITTRTPFSTRFLQRWPEGSPAHASYYRRIMDGPDYRIAQARAP